MAETWDHLDVEELFQWGIELKFDGGLLGLDIDDLETANGFPRAGFQGFPKREVTKLSLMAGLRQSDDSKVLMEGQAA